MHPSQIKGEAKIISSAKPLKQGLEQKKRHKNDSCALCELLQTRTADSRLKSPISLKPIKLKSNNY